MKSVPKVLKPGTLLEHVIPMAMDMRVRGLRMFWKERTKGVEP